MKFCFKLSRQFFVVSRNREQMVMFSLNKLSFCANAIVQRRNLSISIGLVEMFFERGNIFCLV